MSQKKFRLTTGSLYQFALHKNFLSQRSRVSRHFLTFLFCFYEFTCVITLVRKMARKIWKVTICQLINEMHTP